MHDKDAWGCGFCACLLTTWEERCEHIASHFEEKGSTKWNFTNVVLGLLKQTEVANTWNSMMTQRHGDKQNWPTLAWESKKCNRLRYKLETKWDTRVFDIEKLVQDTYDMAEIEAKDVIEPTIETTPERSEPTDSSQGEIVEFKLETSDYGTDQRLQSSHGLPPEHTMMDIDPVETPQSMHQQGLHQTQWPASTDMAHNNLSAATMDVFSGFDTSMTMSTDFSQPVAQDYQQQQNWANSGYVQTQDLMTFSQPIQQPGSFMNYNQPKEVVSVPTSQYASFAHFSPRQSLPASFMPEQPQQHANTPSSRRYVPKLINISNSSHRGPQQEQGPPPPPPKDEHQQNRFSRMIMRRRPSNISQQQQQQPGLVGQQREMGGTWNDELNWG